MELNIEPDAFIKSPDPQVYSSVGNTPHPDGKKVSSEQGLAEKQLWDNFRNGDKKALAAIYTTTVKALLNYGQKFIPDKDIIADLIQDLFIELWNQRENLSHTSSIRYYLLKSLRYKIIRYNNQHKHRSVKYGFTDEYTFELVFSHESKLIEDACQAEENEKLSMALAQLTKRQKEAIYLRYYNNLSYSEIASLMSVSEQSVYNLVSKAIKSLQHYLLHTIYLFLLACCLL
jgi:RNA polymerase sigma factor (sigma-70 family)